MTNSNNAILYSCIFLLVGFFVGWLVWGHRAEPSQPQTTTLMTHQMPDGSMMSNKGTDMTSMMQGMMAGLQGKTGDEFDKEFLSEMIVHHQGAVEMAQLVLKSSTRPELIKLAKDIISAQTKEIEMMKGWQRDWFNQ